ncbi:MAG: signal recognition particle protein [Planctomycetota bacterium]|nr:signal recognition particle protein [Planctomycetota bacterium]
MFEAITERFSGILRRLSSRAKISEKNIRETLREIRVALLEADVAIGVIKDFLARVEEKALGKEVLQGVDPGQQFIYVVHRELTELMGPEDGQLRFQEKGLTVILVAGLQGSGKTTTCAKLAFLLQKEHRRKPLLVAADMQRPAAVDQLRTLGGQIGVPVHFEPEGKPPRICKNAIAEAPKLGCDTVILDTAGRLHVDEEMMAEVREVARVTRPHEVFLVCDAMIGQDAVRSAREFNEQLELTGVVLTKMDGDARGGAALSVKAVTGKPIRFYGTGEKLEGTLETFSPSRMAERILGFGDVVGLVTKVREHIDAEDAEKLQQKLLENTFTLEDFQKQIGVIQKMGNLKGMLQMIPGLGAQLGDMEVDDKELAHVEAIIQSMTRKERQRPEILNTSRRDRIACGSGVNRVEVDDLIKQFGAMRKMMDGMTRVGGKGPLGKIKAIGQAKKKLGNIHTVMSEMAKHAEAMEPGSPKAKKGTRHRRSKEEIKRRRKMERQRRRRNRRR